MRRSLVVVTMVALVSGVMWLGTPASAAGCPPSFDGPIATDDPAIPAEFQDFADEVVDKGPGGNGDGLVCLALLAPNAQSPNGMGFNILDNRVAANI